MDGEVTFDTYIWHYMRTYTNGGDRIFPIGQRRTGKAELELKNATYTIFSQPKIKGIYQKQTKLLLCRMGWTVYEGSH